MIAQPSRLRSFVICLLRESRAAVLVEMAFAIPFLVLIGFAGMEIANLIFAQTQISQMALNAADSASRVAYGGALTRPKIRERDINDVFAGISKQAGSLNFGAHGRIILSSLERNEDDGQWLHWQRCFGDLPVRSSYGEAGDGESGTGFPGMGPEGREVTAADGTAIMFVEIFYDYQPLLYGKWLGPKRIHSAAAFNIREGRDLSQVFNAENAPISSCT